MLGFEKLHKQIKILNEGAPQNVERDEFENNYYEFITEAEVKLNIKDTYASTGEVRTETCKKLPTINLLKFARHFENWLLLKDSSESVDYNHTLLSTIQTFQYLRFC